jgi:hypothetical protein
MEERLVAVSPRAAAREELVVCGHNPLARRASPDSERPKLSLQRIEDRAPVVIALVEDSEVLAEFLNASLKRSDRRVVANGFESAFDKHSECGAEGQASLLAESFGVFP